MYRKCIFERIFVTPKRQYFEKSENEMSIHNFCVQEVSKAHLKNWRGPCISISWFLHFQLTSFLFNFLLFGNILLIFQILSNACYFPKLFYVRCRYHLRKTYFLPYNAQLRVVFTLIDIWRQECYFQWRSILQNQPTPSSKYMIFYFYFHKMISSFLSISC